MAARLARAFSLSRRASSLALLFPGQGAQRPGMSLDLSSDFPAARRALDEVDEALGRRLSRDMHARDDGAAARLARTELAQPALLAHSAAALAALRAELGEDAGGFGGGTGAGAGGIAALAATAQPAPLLRLGPHAIVCVLGHSVGEFAALVAAGAMTLGGAARALRLRARLMQEAADADAARGGGSERAMLALLLAPAPAPAPASASSAPASASAAASRVRTATAATIEDAGSLSAEERALAPLRAAVTELAAACRAAEAELGSIAAVAGANSPQQVVLSGHAAALERAAAIYRERCAAAAPGTPPLPALRRALRLPVGAPFHCAIMAPAEEALRRAGFARDLAGDPGGPGASAAGADADDAAAVRLLAAPRAPLVSGVDAAPHADPHELRGLLADGLTRPVRFAEAVAAARGRALGAARFLEVGPGGTLASLVRQTLDVCGRGGGGAGGGGDAVERGVESVGSISSVGTTAELRAYVAALEAAERRGGGGAR